MMPGESETSRANGDEVLEGIAARAFGGAYAGEWGKQLRRYPVVVKGGRESGGGVMPTFYNVELILACHEAMRDVIVYDEFSGRVIKFNEPPWGGLGEWGDADTLEGRHWLTREYSIEPKPQIVDDVVQLIARRNPHNEVREYLEGLEWDRVPRVVDWLCRYLDAIIPVEQCALPVKDRDTLTYLRVAGQLWLISAVARVFKPGCKADCVLILEGAQGTGKSSALSELGRPWFTDTPIRLGDKDSYQALAGKWIVELSELDALSRAENSAAKAFFSSSVDRYRPSYGRRAIDHPRQCVFAGSVNHGVYLKDETGGRRYWPVCCGEIDLAALRRDRDQLWAEAVELYRQGASWHVAPEHYRLFQAEQEARYVGDPWEATIDAWASSQAVPVTIEAVLAQALNLKANEQNVQVQMRAGRILQRLGYQRRRAPRAIDQPRGWIYEKPGQRSRLGPTSVQHDAS